MGEMQGGHPEKGAVHDRGIGSTTRSPDSWRGTWDGDRRFHSLQMEPLRPEKGSACKASGTSPTAGEGGFINRIKGDVWSLFLFIVAVGAVAAFSLILRGYYGRLRTLDGNMAAATPQSTIGVVAVIETPTVVTPGTTPSPRDTGTPTRTETAGVKREASPSPSREPSLTPPREKPTALPGAAPPERLVIPSIGVDAPIVQGQTEEALRKGVGHLPGSANPGARGNMVLSAHNDIHGEIFRDLETLKTGADVYVHTDARILHYVVQSMQIVLPTKVEVIEPTDDARLTMITCHPYLIDTHRVVAVAHLAE
ncbi:MAG: sortase [Anaerolineales bacterium]